MEPSDEFGVAAVPRGVAFRGVEAPRTRIRRQPIRYQDNRATMEVENPLTGQPIEVGGLTFRQLTMPLVTDVQPMFEYNRDTNRLKRVWSTVRPAMVTAIDDYETGETQERSSTMTFNVDVLLSFMRVTFSYYTSDNNGATVHLMDQFRRDVISSGMIAEYVATNMSAVAYSGILLQVHPNGGILDEELAANRRTRYPSPESIAALSRQMQVERNMRVRSDKPYLLPFINVDQNAGVDDKCVDRFLGVDLDATPEYRTVDGMARWAQENGVGLQLFDMVRGLMVSVDAPGPVSLRGVVYEQHVYPIVRGRRPMMSHQFTGAYESNQDLAEQMAAVSEPMVIMTINKNVYVGPTGIVKPGRVVTEKWMFDLMRHLPRSAGWDPDEMLPLKRSAVALMYQAPEFSDERNYKPDEYRAYDMEKCYWWILRDLLIAWGDRICCPTLYTRWRPSPSDLRHDELDPLTFYKISGDVSRYGVRTDILLGMAVRRLMLMGADVQIHAQLQMNIADGTGARPMPRKDRDAAIKALDELDDVQRKAVSILVGTMGRMDMTEVHSFPLTDERERLYYEKTYDAELAVDEVHVSLPKLSLFNRLHWHVLVVQYATAVMLDAMHLVQAKTGALPRRVVTDSLTYHLHDLRTPFVTDPEERLTEAFAHLGTLQRFPNLRPEAPPARALHAMSNSVIEIPIRTTYKDAPRCENVTFIGPPGTGKTTKAMADYKFDRKLCYSNKGARRIGGSTIHSVLKLSFGNDQPALHELSNQLVFVDEFQAASRELHAFLYAAYRLVDARFVFAMDPDQLPPVGENSYKLMMRDDPHPFFGEIKRHTVDYRNDAELIDARTKLMAYPPAFFPTLISFSEALRAFDPVNDTAVCFLNATRFMVNDRSSQRAGIRYGDPRGKYISLNNDPSSGLANSETVYAVEVNNEGHGKWRGDYAGSFVVGKRRRIVRNLIDWAFCTTTHKMIGETVTTDDAHKFYIFDWDRMDLSVQYTALTRATRLQDIYFVDQCTRDELSVLLPTLQPYTLTLMSRLEHFFGKKILREFTAATGAKRTLPSGPPETSPPEPPAGRARH